MLASAEGMLGTAFKSPAELGFAADKGFAMFGTDLGTVAVVPVGDRDTFLRAVGGTKGTDTDIAFGRTCKTVGSIYACAHSAELFDALGKNPALVNHLDVVGTRGDVEVAGSVPIDPWPIVAAAAIELEPGAARVRFAARNMPAEIVGMFPHAQRPRVGDKTAGFAVLDIARSLAKMRVDLAPEVSAADFAATIAAPATIGIDAGQEAIDLRVPLSSTQLARRIVDHCESSALVNLGAKLRDGVCHFTLDTLHMPLDLWLEGNELRLGTKNAPPLEARTSLSPIGKELAASEWPLVFYGRGTGMVAPETAVDAGGLNEIGFGMRMDGDVLRGIASVRTIWANPADVAEKLVARIGDNDAKAARAIADAAPSSPFAADRTAGWKAVTIAKFEIGMIFSLAIPAFMQYLKNAPRPEAPLQLGVIGRNLKTLAQLEGRFPTGKAPLTPAMSCCAKPCNDPAGWKHPTWVAIGFLMEEPHAFRYEYESTDGKSFVARARGDRDCDGTEITFTLRGTVEPSGHVDITMTAPDPKAD